MAPATDTPTKRFRMTEFVKDGYLAKALRAEIEDLSGKDLELAQEVITEVAGSGVTGTFDELLRVYVRAIRRALHPERKIVKNAKIDRSLMKNPQLAAVLDRELEDVTKEELARANTAVKQIVDAVRDLKPHDAKGRKAEPGEERFVTHEPGPICKVEGEHSTLGGACGYFKDPLAWPDVFRTAVREAIDG
jgi:hypothetical protein